MPAIRFEFGSCLLEDDCKSGWRRCPEGAHLLEQPRWREWKFGKANPGCVGQRIRHCASDGVHRAFTHRLGAHRPNSVSRVCEIDFCTRDIREGRNSVVAQSRIRNRAVLVHDHVLYHRPADPLSNSALDLTCALKWVHHGSRVGSVNALENINFAGYPIHCESETMDIERN